MKKLYIGALSLLLLAGCTANPSKKNSTKKPDSQLKTTTCEHVSTSDKKKTILQSKENSIKNAQIIKEGKLKDYGLTKEEAEKQQKKDEAALPKGIKSSLKIKDDLATYDTTINVSEAKKSDVTPYGLIEAKNGEFGLQETIKALTEQGYKCK